MIQNTLEYSISTWYQTFGFLAALPSWLVATIGILAIYLFVIFPSVAIMSYLERKYVADFQARVGPNRSGPAGIFQPIADLIKLLEKDKAGSLNWREASWLVIHTMALYSTVAVIPLGSALILVNTDMSAFLPFWAALVLALGTMLMGFSQGSVDGWFGGVRVASQALAGALPALISMLCAGVHAGGFRWTDFSGVQSSSPTHWTATSNPFLFIAFIVFIVSGLILLAVPPMDGGISSVDIHGGVASELSGRRLSLFKLGRFYGFFLWAVIAVVLFLGGWRLPFHLSPTLESNESFALLEVLELSCLLFKTFLLMIILTWVARVNPRGRVDQTTDFAWTVLSPFALVALIGCGLWEGWRALL